MSQDSTRIIQDGSMLAHMGITARIMEKDTNFIFIFDYSKKYVIIEKEYTVILAALYLKFRTFMVKRKAY